MRTRSLSGIPLMALACAAPPPPALIPTPPQLGFTVEFQPTTVGITLNVAQPGYLLVIEHTPDGLLALLPLATIPTPDSVLPGAYRMQRPRYFSLVPPPLRAPPSPPCWESRPGDSGEMQRVWTGFCGVSPGMVNSRLSRESDPPESWKGTHTIIALQLDRPVPTQALEALLDALPITITPQDLAERVQRHFSVGPAGLAWVHIAPRTI